MIKTGLQICDVWQCHCSFSVGFNDTVVVDCTDRSLAQGAKRFVVICNVDISQQIANCNSEHLSTCLNWQLRHFKHLQVFAELNEQWHCQTSHICDSLSIIHSTTSATNPFGLYLIQSSHINSIHHGDYVIINCWIVWPILSIAIPLSISCPLKHGLHPSIA